MVTAHKVSDREYAEPERCMQHTCGTDRVLCGDGIKPLV
jgi:hypothetical protein